MVIAYMYIHVRIYVKRVFRCRTTIIMRFVFAIPIRNGDLNMYLYFIYINIITFVRIRHNYVYISFTYCSTVSVYHIAFLLLSIRWVNAQIRHQWTRKFIITIRFIIIWIYT